MTDLKTLREDVAKALCFSEGCIRPECISLGRCQSPAWHSRLSVEQVNAAIKTVLDALEAAYPSLDKAGANTLGMKNVDDCLHIAAIHGFRLLEGRPPLEQAWLAMIAEARRIVEGK